MSRNVLIILSKGGIEIARLILHPIALSRLKSQIRTLSCVLLIMLILRSVTSKALGLNGHNGQCVVNFVDEEASRKSKDFARIISRTWLKPKENFYLLKVVKERLF